MTMDQQLQPQEFWTFLSGLFREALDTFNVGYWPPEKLLVRIGTWTGSTYLPDNFKTSGFKKAPWKYPSGLGWDPVWLYGFLIFLVLCMAAQLVGHDIPASCDEGQGSRAGSRLEVREEALATIFTPVEGCHPKDYKPILKSISNLTGTSNRGEADVVLNFENTWKVLVTGRLELKDEEVLEELFSLSVAQRNVNSSNDAGVWAFGCQVSLGFGWKWKASAISKILFAAGEKWRETLWWRFGWRGKVSSDWGKIPNLDTCLIEDTLDLDFIPIPCITSALTAAVERLLAPSGPTSDYDGLIVEFTCLARDVGFMSNAFFSCCTILLPSLGHNLSKSKKTALPFFVSVEDIIKKVQSIPTRPGRRMSSGETHSEIVVKRVKDISMLHADALDLHENDMVFDRWVRSSFVARHGPEAWRETRLRLKWEAALLRARVLVRHKITVTLRELVRK